MQIYPILKYINENIIISKNIQYIINKIKELEIFFDKIDENNKIEIMLQVIDNSNIVSRNIQTLIDNKIISKVTDEFVLSFIDAFCILKNIEIQDETIEIDFQEDNYKYLLNDIRNLKELTKEEKQELLVKAQQGNLEAKNEFIEQNMRLVIYVANRYKNDKYDFQDLIQDGSIGLMEAVDRFDISRGYSFSTYAIWWIRQSITRALMNNKENIRIPCHTYNDLRKIEKVKEEAIEELSDQEISDLTNINIKTIQRLKIIPRSTDSIDRQIGDEDGYDIGDTVASDESIEDKIINRMTNTQVSQILYSCLQESIISELEFKILYYRLGFSGEIKTYQKIGEMNNLTKQRIEQLFKRAIGKIKFSKYSDLLAECYGIDKSIIKKKGRKK